MTSPVSIPAGHKLLAADFDAYENLTAVWTTNNPTISASTTPPNMGTNTPLGRYRRVGRTVDFEFSLTVASTGGTWNVGSGDWLVTLPYPALTQAIEGFPGTGWAFDTSAGLFRTYVFAVYFANANFASFLIDAGGRVGSAGPGTAWSAGDIIGGYIKYMTAS